MVAEAYDDLVAISDAVERANSTDEGIKVGDYYRRMECGHWVSYLSGAGEWGPVVDWEELEAVFQAGRKDALDEMHGRSRDKR